MTRNVLKFTKIIQNSNRLGFTTFSLHKRGFTLVELMVAISIIAVLGTIGMSTYTQSQVRARDLKRKQDIRAIANALELFYQRKNRYPCSSNWQISTSGINWLNDANASSDPNCTGAGASLAPNYITSLPTDPLNTGIYVYRFWSEGWNLCQTGHTSYMLFAELENAKDPETITNKPIDICGTTTPNWGGGMPSANAFVISAR